MKVSVVVPALNEERALGLMLSALAERVPGVEVVVADAGSTDGTRTVALEHAARPLVVGAERPITRGCALNLGAAQASGDVLWFLHADTLPLAGGPALIEQALAEPGVIGGAFEFGFTTRDWRLRIVEWANRVRYRVRRRFYGDQGIFVRREAFTRIGGFPEYGILEDAHFCRNAQREGRLRLIREVLPTSPRRFVEGGVLSVFWFDLRVWFFDALGCDVQRYAARYRAANLDVRGGAAQPSR